MMARSGLLAAALAAVGVMAMGMGGARANIIASGVFTSDHCTGGCLTGQTNGGTVTVTDHQNGILDFDVELSNGNQFINGGFDASLGFNLVGNPTITYTSYPSTRFTIPGTLDPQQAAGSLHMDGTGYFEYGLDGIGNGGSDPLGSSLMFSISAPGLDITDLEKNANQQFFAADIISGTAKGSDGKFNTGGIDLSGGLQINQQCTGTCDPSVPEPASFALLGAGLIGLGFIRRRRA